MNKKLHKVVNILVRGGFNEWDAISMANTHYDEVTRLYPDLTAPSQIAKMIVVAA